jgi:hypothetical protein
MTGNAKCGECVRWHGTPHEEHCSDIDVVGRFKVVTNAEVQSSDEESKDDFVSNSGTQKFRILVVSGGAILDQRYKALP